MKTLYLVLALIGVFLVGGLLTYYLIPHTVEKIVIQERNNTIIVEKNVTVEKRVNVCNNRVVDRTPNVAYVIEDGVKKKAGSSYSNEPSYCAKMHNRSLC